MKLNQRFALISFNQSVIEKYNPVLIKESDSLEELEEVEILESGRIGHTILENTENGIVDYYTRDSFEMRSYY